MTTADELLDQIFSWIEQRRRCADQLIKLAVELESLTQKCKGGECVGSSVAVVGAACVMGAGITFLTGGAAAPFLGLLGSTYLGAGAIISITAKLIEHFMSSDTMKDAKKIEENSNKCARNIQQLFEKLKAEKTAANRFPNPDDVDRHILTDILRAVARRSGVRTKIDFRMVGDEPYLSFGGGPQNLACDPMLGHGIGHSLPIMVTAAGFLTIFTLRASGKKCNFLFAKGAQQLIKEISVTGMKTVLKGGSMVVGGAIGMAFALPEAIDNWTDLIKNNNVTEASQSLRDTAKAIKKMTRTLSDQFEDMKRMLEEMEKEQREHKETLAKVKRSIENPERSFEEKQILLMFAMKTCQNEQVRQWLRWNSGSETFFKLVDLFKLMQKEIMQKSDEDESDDEDDESEVDIIFVAHGSIRDSKIPASCLLPLSNIKDVLLYSPWNCLLAAPAAYDIATGLIQPNHRKFLCNTKSGCEIPHERHVPGKLPDDWNSMKEADQIPNIMVSTLRVPQDGAWRAVVRLTEEYGKPGRGRVVIPFILPGLTVRIPFYIVTWVMSLVLSFFQIQATVHLAACLGDKSTKKFSRGFLEEQYSYTIDNSAMTSAAARVPIRHVQLYRNFQAMFD
ncbi:uncharacterized protein [Paralichthys olivaceus]|uniref:uncharacterized protein n=1 Tax=Paralichthys olivaceus TaxID=8255 RepID=UPI00097CF402|nr:PREDICTED: uncharacterized protein LOC109643844 [Paralichthys olivaceus]